MSAPAILHPGELRWETRLLAVVTATMVVFGIASMYGAASLLSSKSGENIGLSYTITQADRGGHRGYRAADRVPD